MIKATITSQNERVVLASVEALPNRILQALETGLARALLGLVGIVQTQWIQDGARIKGELGPGARLHSVTGRLRSGMQSSVKRSGETVIGSIGNSVKYAAFHEFGFHGTVNVRAHARVTEQFSGALDEETDTRRPIRSNTGDLLGFKESRKASTKFQKGGFVNVQFVKAHTRQVNYQGKPFVRPALNANGPLILGEINKELAAIQN
jgi:phage gpG-like protein